MSRPNQSKPEAFPELNTQNLKEYAKEWVGRYPSIKIDRVTLYRYDTNLQDDFVSVAKKKNTKFHNAVVKAYQPVQYAIVFAISDCSSIPENELEYPYNIEYEGTPEDIECIKLMKDCYQAYLYESFGRPHPFLDSAFLKKVITHTIIKDFRKEWGFHYTRPTDEEPLYVLKNKAFLILYDPTISIECENSEEDFDNKKLSYDDFEKKVKNLCFSYENPLEIKIQKKGRPAIILNYSQWNINGKNVNTNVTWKAFIENIRNPPHIFNVGSSHADEYSKYQKRLYLINNKLTDFFNSSSQLWSVPPKYKFYERYDEEGKGKGMYSFKFKCGQEVKVKVSKFEKLTDKELLETFDRLYGEEFYISDRLVFNDLLDALIIISKRGLKTDDEMNKIHNEIQKTRNH